VNIRDRESKISLSLVMLCVSKYCWGGRLIGDNNDREVYGVG
jgi:hypothetical protein